jgi:hypothetical protein
MNTNGQPRLRLFLQYSSAAVTEMTLVDDHPVKLPPDTQICRLLQEVIT